MLRIIVETTHLVINQYAHDANNGRVHTSTYITIMSIYAHAFSVKPEKKKRLEDVSPKEDVKGNKYNISSFSPSPSIHLLQYADLDQPEMRVLCEVVGTQNV